MPDVDRIAIADAELDRKEKYLDAAEGKHVVVDSHTTFTKTHTHAKPNKKAWKKSEDVTATPL